MKLLQKEAPDNFNIFLYGDDHLGTTLRSEKGFEKFKGMLKSEYEGVKDNYAIDHGDIIEAIMLDDPRFLPYTTDGNIQQPAPCDQKEEAMMQRLVYKDKLVCILEGNHTLKLWRSHKYITSWVCDKLGVPYGTWSVKISWVDKEDKVIFKSFHTHGSKPITSTADDPKRRLANKELILKRHLKQKAGDCLLMSKGHTHQLLICEPEKEMYMTDNGKEIVHKYRKSRPTDDFIHPDHRWYVNTGGFRKMYGDGDLPDYTERFEYDPLELGFAIAKVRDRKLTGIDKVVL